MSENQTTALPTATDLFTDKMYVGLRNGRCVAIAREMRNDPKENRRTRVEWAKDGLDVLTVNESDMTPYYDDMKAGVQERRTGTLI